MLKRSHKAIVSLSVGNMRRRLIGAALVACGISLVSASLADTAFTNFAFPATGAPTSRTMPNRLSEIRNVKDFGALGDAGYATCSGGTDDTSTIQAAINAGGGTPTDGIIFFPYGAYRITGSLNFDTVTNIIFTGAAGAQICGNFADALLKRNVNSPVAGVKRIENLFLKNSHASGKAIMFHSIIGGKIVNVRIEAGIGIETYNSQSVSIDSSSLISSAAPGTIGIVAGNATSIVATDVTAYDQGVRHSNVGLTIEGGRYETNTVGIMLGVAPDGTTNQSTGVKISGLSMEANQTHIWSNALAGGQIGALSMGGGVAMINGLRLTSAQDLLVSGLTVGGTYSNASTPAGENAAIRVNSCARCTFISTGASSWSVAVGDTSIYTQTNKP